MANISRNDVRNIAIIAHVDHGKTTLVDAMFKQTNSFRKNQVVNDCAMDSNDIERERGITILAKATAVTYENTRINIVDTPGHADFGSEVERVLKMVDSVVLLVDAAEGPMPQTRFVTQKALSLGLRPIVLINKIDRQDAQPEDTLNKVFDLFVALKATDEQLDFPVLYSVGREGWAVKNINDPKDGLDPLFKLILEHVPPPPGDVDSPLCLQVTTLDYDDFLGYVGIGRIETGRVKMNDRVLLGRISGATEEFRVMKLLAFQGLSRIEQPEAKAGDIIAVTGMSALTVGDTITSIESPRILPKLQIDEPTVNMTFMVNNGPLAGTEGKYVTSRNLRERLEKELRSNVGLRMEPTDQPDAFRVAGRGELHLSVLIETMRREGYELMVSQPQVIYKKDEDGARLEPFEEVVCDCDQSYSSTVIDKLNRRGGILQELDESGVGRKRLRYRIPARGLIGYRTEYLTDTRGTGVMYSRFLDYGPFHGELKGRQNGTLVVQEDGVSVTYSMYALQDRGAYFIGAQEKVYAGQVVGIHAKQNDLIINICKEKHLTNIRTTAADEKRVLVPPIQMTLEKSLEFIAEDELVEITPKNIRIRKRILDHNVRKRSEKSPEIRA
jgi:GTP-binding protein